MSVATSWPCLTEVLVHIPTYPNYINIRPLARALKEGGDRSPHLLSRIRRRLDSALEQGIIIKKVEFGIAKYWKPGKSEVAVVKAPAPQINPQTASSKNQQRKMQVELIKFVEFLTSTNKAMNNGQLQEDFATEALRVLKFAANYEGHALGLSDQQIRDLFNLWQDFLPAIQGR